MLNVDTHPRCGASMMVHTRMTMPSSDKIVPTKSNRPTWSAFDSGTTSSTPTMTNNAAGTFIQNTECQEKCSRSQPPAVGPMAIAKPAIAVQAAMAMARSLASVKMLVIMANVAGKTAAAKTPMAARAMITCSRLEAKAPTSDIAPTPIKPMIITRRRPKRSPRWPKVSRNPAKVNVYASTIHCRSLTLANKSTLIVGNATLTTVLSSTTRSSARQMKISAVNRRDLVIMGAEGAGASV